MANLLQRLTRSTPAPTGLSTVDDYAELLSQWYSGGLTAGLLGSGIQQTQPGSRSEPIANDFSAYAQAAYASNGPVFACMLVRMLVFSGVRFTFQRFSSSKPSEFFGTQELAWLERPWVGGTTQDILVRTMLDADLAGNAYWTRFENELVRLRPDWVEIVLEPRRHPQGGVLGWRKLGYLYTEGGPGAAEPVALLADEVAHFAPIPDPLASYRGMSWLTPVIREVQADRQMLRHKDKYFANAATPNLAVRLPMMDPDKFQKFKATMDAGHAGPQNAGKTLYLGGGAEVTVLGANMEQMAFTEVAAAGETRIAGAAGVPPVIAGLSKGLDSSTYSNYSQARRRFGDGTIHPLWQNVAGSFSPLVREPGGARLWYDASQVPFLREDAKDAAEVARVEAATVKSYIDAGYKPESVIRAIQASDLSLLEHSGLYSVQLQPAGAQSNTVTGEPVDAELVDDSADT